MKKNLPLFLLFSFFVVSMINAQVFVNQSATGANDGSSWDNAYTDLNTAIDNTESGDLWIASGNYTPGGATNSYRITKNLNLYGGFDGTETSLEDRNLTVNVTVLDGDQLGNDLDFNFDTLLKEDNSRHIIWIDSLLDNVTIDGFVIKNGFTLDDGDLDLEERAGAGIFAYSGIDVMNVSFENNFARAGAAAYVAGNITPIEASSFDFISVTKSSASSQSAGIFTGNLNDVYVANSQFVGNLTSRGAFYPLRCNGVLVTNCSFRENISGGFGGAFFIWNNNNVIIENSEFIDNAGSNGGVCYIDGREAITDADNVIIRNCTFEGNSATSGSGGAVNTWEMSITVENCSFDGNTAPGGSSGALALNGNSGDDATINVTNNTFTDNFAGFGGALGCYNANGIITIDNNDFTENGAATSGGAAINAFGPNVTYTNNTFSQDSARFGGALATQNNTTTVSLISNDFIGNLTDVNAGVLNLIDGVDFLIDDCFFDLNSANEFGGVMNASRNNDTIAGSLTIRNSIFANNATGLQAGALNINNFNTTITSCVFAFNSNIGDGYGGAISMNGFGYESTVDIINCTFADNFANLAAGIATYTDGDPTSILNVNLGNNIFSNVDGENYLLEEGTPVVTSLGGNYSSDDSTDELLTSTNDVSDGDEIDFVDPDLLDYRLEDDTSPAINIGIAAIAPETDILGVARFMEPEAGAFEFDPTSLFEEELLENESYLTIKPNPVSEVMTFQLENDWNGHFTAQVISLHGQIIRSESFVKSSDSQVFTQQVNDLPTGSYILAVRNGRHAVVTKMIKL